MNTSKLSYALEAAALGIEVFPVWGVHRQCDCVDEVCEHWQCDCGVENCRDAGKHPMGDLAPHGHLNATTDEATIREWWSQYPTANIGGRPPADNTVVDVDPRNGGNEAIKELTENHGILPNTRVALTGGLGQHWWFRYSGPARGKLGPGLDVKTSSGYVVLPGSRHKSGRLYRWFNPGVPVSDAPTWMVDLLSAGAKHETITSEHAALPVPLPPKWEHHVRTGDLGAYPSRSELWAALVHPVIDAGGTVDDYLAILSNPAHGIYARWRDLGSKAEREARYVWERYAPGHKPGKPPAERVAERWETARLALIATLSPRQRPGYLAGYWALTELAITHQTYAPIAPVRSVAELAGLDKNTAHAAMRHMVNVELVKRGAPEGRTVDDWTTTLEITNFIQTPDPGGDYESVPSLSPVQTPPWLPAWRNRSGWGKAGWLVDGALTLNPISDYQVSVTSGVSLRTTRDRLRDFGKAMTAIETDDGWVRGPVDPSEIRFPDAEVAINRQLKRHNAEREGRRTNTTTTTERRLTQLNNAVARALAGRAERRETAA